MSRFHVYFMRPVGADGPVKIGCSTMVEERLRAMSPWAPFPLEIAARIPGDFALEGRFHKKFIADRIHGEWFAASAELTDTIASVALGTFDTESLPTGARENWWTRKGVEYSPERRKGLSLRARLRNLRHKTGMCPPADLDAAADTFEALPRADRDLAERRILHFLEAPIDRGAVLSFPWCVSRFVAWATGKGVPLENMPPRGFEQKEAA